MAERRRSNAEPVTEVEVRATPSGPVTGPFRHFFAEVAHVETGSLEVIQDEEPTHVRRVPAEARPPEGWVVNDTYEILELLKEGGMGRVYRARHVTLDRIVCLKTMRQDLGAGSDADRLVERFRLEAKAAGTLSHPNVIRILDFGQDSSGTLYLAMDFVAGRDLERLLKDEFPLGEERICRIMAQVLDALSEAHAHGVVHRDLKPGNVMVEDRPDAKDFVRVVDFGIAKVEGGPKLTATGFVTGTAQYMAPEQASAQDVDHRADIYAAGCVLYELVTRTVPFTSDNPTQAMYAHVHLVPVPPSVRRPEVALSPEFEALILKALRKAPSERPQTAAEFRDALLALAERARARRAAAQSNAEIERRRQEAAVLSARLAELEGRTPPGDLRDLRTAQQSAATQMLPAERPSTASKVLPFAALGVGLAALAVGVFLAMRPAAPNVPTPAPIAVAPPAAAGDPKPIPEQAAPVKPGTAPVAATPKPVAARPPDVKAGLPTKVAPPPSSQPVAVAPAVPPPAPVTAPVEVEPPKAVVAPLPTPAVARPPESMVSFAATTAQIGCADGPDCPPDARPAITPPVGAFRLDRTEVRAADYQRCIEAGACTAPGTGPGCLAPNASENRPVNCVTWAQADAFCRWRGARLPSEFEWEHAARGAEGRLFPWGDAPPDCSRVRTTACGASGPALVAGSRMGATADGIQDLAGNVREWTGTFYNKNTYVLGRAPLTGPGRVVRGGSWENTSPRNFHGWYRLSFPEDRAYPSLGFRCAR